MFVLLINLREMAAHLVSECQITMVLPQVTYISAVQTPMKSCKKVKVKSSMARSLPVENLLPQNVGSIINYLQSFTKVAQW